MRAWGRRRGLGEGPWDLGGEVGIHNIYIYIRNISKYGVLTHLFDRPLLLAYESTKQNFETHSGVESFEIVKKL